MVTNAKTSASVHQMDTKVQFDAGVISKGVECITASVKQGANLAHSIMVILRSCKDRATAEGTLAFAEVRACEKFGVKSLSELAKNMGLTSLSYQTTKSSFLTAMDKAELHVKTLGEWYKFTEEHDKAAHKEVPKGFLNVWSERYQDREKEKGSTLFFRDLNEAKNASVTLTTGRKRLENEQAKARAQAQGNGTLTAAAPGGVSTDSVTAVRSGGGTGESAAMKEGVAEAYGSLGRILIQAQEVLSESDIVYAVNELFQRVAKRVDEVRKARSEAATPESAGRRQRPNKAAAALQKAAKATQEAAAAVADLPDLTEADKRNIEEVEKVA